MKLGAFTLSYWANEQEARNRKAELELWQRHVSRIANCDTFVIGCGTYSNPTHCPINAVVANAEVQHTRLYDCETWTYSCCAEEAALWYFLLNTDCDAILHLCSDGFVRDKLYGEINKLMASDKLILAYNWQDMIDDAFYIMKRQGIVHYLNSRMRPNLSKTRQIIMEREKAIIFNGKWINPMPALDHYRYDGIHPSPSYEEVLTKWPMCIRPPKELLNLYANHLL